ncbi:AAA family ATPase [Deinococcus sp. SDU3-2]|uniref:AAA family ATPase n=1 Tax=Deinococcus terrestris TaxID=2651870 RepID=A0A7X1NWW1_9DEIO|nr:AAA family ATPase [Deinococcus terrestris]MPY67298.1 AAA family ATPase [Deinococcus terrestris]
MVTFHLLVGLPGSGKTTLARRLEEGHRALRLTPDEWMLPLFSAGESGDRRWVLENELLWGVAARALSLGVSVVLDYGLWSRAERDEFRSRGEALGVRVELLWLDVPQPELWRRLEARNRDLPPHTFSISRAELEEWWTLFQRPGPDELSQSEWRILNP